MVIIQKNSNVRHYFQTLPSFVFRVELISKAQSRLSSLFPESRGENHSYLSVNGAVRVIEMSWCS